VDEDRRKNTDENIRWNYSMVEATAELIAYLREASLHVLDDLRYFSTCFSNGFYFF